jgi:hypothetical protein
MIFYQNMRLILKNGNILNFFNLKLYKNNIYESYEDNYD